MQSSRLRAQKSWTDGYLGMSWTVAAMGQADGDKGRKVGASRKMEQIPTEKETPRER